jgi:predicted nucleotidyltransferase
MIRAHSKEQGKFKRSIWPMDTLSPEQVVAVRQLQQVCRELATPMVIIGAMAYRFWVRDFYRHTLDVDVAVAVDLDNLPELTAGLEAKGWKRYPLREHRWITPEGARLDLIPAGPELRRQKVLEWPGSGMRMSLVGFDHAFVDAVEYRLSSDLTASVVSLPTLALLKIVAYLENPYEREKDLADFAALLSRFEPDDEKRFAADVLDAGMDYDAVPAYLIGKDLAALCSGEETTLVAKLLGQLQDHASRSFQIFSRVIGNFEERTTAIVAAVTKGFQPGLDR